MKGVDGAPVVSSGERGALMAIGGSEDKAKTRRVLNAFMALAGGPQAHIAIIPAASMQAALAGNLYKSLFQDLGAASVEVWCAARTP